MCKFIKKLTRRIISQIGWSKQVSDNLEEIVNGNLCYCLKFLIADVRKTTGERYPSKILKSINYMILHYLRYLHKRGMEYTRTNALVRKRRQCQGINES